MVRPNGEKCGGVTGWVAAAAESKALTATCAPMVFTFNKAGMGLDKTCLRVGTTSTPSLNKALLQVWLHQTALPPPSTKAHSRTRAVEDIHSPIRAFHPMLVWAEGK
jgi:hypothetical protein